eukprot:6181440-Pleurochrysis_carterae.AAC.1
MDGLLNHLARGYVTYTAPVSKVCNRQRMTSVPLDNNNESTTLQSAPIAAIVETVACLVEAAAHTSAGTVQTSVSSETPQQSVVENAVVEDVVESSCAQTLDVPQPAVHPATAGVAKTTAPPSPPFPSPPDSPAPPQAPPTTAATAALPVDSTVAPAAADSEFACLSDPTSNAAIISATAATTAPSAPEAAPAAAALAGPILIAGDRCKVALRSDQAE